MMKWKKQYTLWLAAAIAAVVLLTWLVQSVKKTEVSIDVDEQINVTPEQIESIKAIGEWEFLAIADEELVDTVRKGIFSDDQLVRIYYGTVRLGINMHQVEPGWMKASGDSIEVTLPKIDLLDRDFIDEARTKSYQEFPRERTLEGGRPRGAVQKSLPEDAAPLRDAGEHPQRTAER